MTAPPVYDIDPARFYADPYPDLAAMRARTPVARVPQLGAILITRRDDIAECEKKIDVFSSVQPEGLMTKLMGQNMMRKDGEDHQVERRASFPAFSPRTVRDHWKARFIADTARTLAAILPRGRADMVREIALTISGDALRVITGLEQFTAQDIDETSQAMIDGISNYLGDPAIEARCHAATARIDAAIEARAPAVGADPDMSLLSVQLRAGLPMDTVKANIRLAISGGQNEPRDVIAGAVYALLKHPDQLAMVVAGEIGWGAVFDEYVRWMSPIGMSPREIAKAYSHDGIDFAPGERVFLMFSSANRDAAHFEDAERFDITRDASKHIAFGAGPHFCAGATASRALIAEVALPMIFERLPGLRLSGEARFGGWAFRGLLDLPVEWDAG